MFWNAAARSRTPHWPLLGESRLASQANVFWHETHAPVVYAAKARTFGLTYPVKDFAEIH